MVKEIVRGASMIPQIIGRQYLVYLAGPVTGLTFEEATGWYEPVKIALPRHILALTPFRGRTTFVPRDQGADPFEGAKFVALRSYNDVDRSDGLLVNFLPAKVVSRGTCGEIGRAAFRKPVVVVMREGNPHWGDPLVHGPSIIVPTLEEGIKMITMLVSPI